MRAMVSSVKDKGVTQPAIVRPREDGGYEIVSGHRLFRFLCGGFGLRGCGLVLICFRGTATALRLFRLFGFFICFFRSLRLLFRFLHFCRVRLFPAGSCRPFLDLLFLHNFSEVIDRNLWVLYLRGRPPKTDKDKAAAPKSKAPAQKPEKAVKKEP